MKKSKIRGFVVNEYVLTLPEVENMIYHEGAKGLGKFVRVCMNLLRCYHTICSFDDVEIIARLIRVRPNCLKRWIRECGIFTVDDKNNIFFFPYLRRLVKCKKEVSDEEINIIKEHGSFYIGNENDAEKDEKKDAENDEKDSIFSSNLGTISAKNSENCSEIKNLSESQKSDNKSNTKSPYKYTDTNTYDNTNILNQNINININHKNKSVVDVDKSSFKIFEEKIFNNKTWRDTTTLSHGINLNDDTTRIFAKWLLSYCISRNEKRKIDDDISNYANYLLMKGHYTRRLLQDYLHQQPEDKRHKEQGHRIRDEILHPLHVNNTQYVYWNDGMRIGSVCKLLPGEAPLHTDFNWRRSCRQHKSVDVSSWDRVAETVLYEKPKVTKYKTEISLQVI